MRPFLRQINYSKAEKLFQVEEDEGTVDGFQNCLSSLELVTLELQFDATLLLEARALFNEVDDECFYSQHRLNSNATIVENGNFEQPIVKVQRDYENVLKAVWQKAIFDHVCDGCKKFVAKSRSAMSFAQRLLNQSKLESDSKTFCYLDLRLAVATFNLCGRLFFYYGFSFRRLTQSVAVGKH